MMSKNRFTLTLVLISLIFNTFDSVGQRKSGKEDKVGNSDHLRVMPRLVVGIVVDQMRYDYLTRFWDHYGDDGFKRLVNGGFNCKNNHFNYAPTYTGPGHASVYTGTTPASHGIIANNWYDRELGVSVYCAADEAYNSVGTASDAGKMSPHRMMVTTVADQLRLHTQMRGKTIAIALKDRASVLPGGHIANGAFWFYGENEGNWITSSFYMDALPKWVIDFNASNVAEGYKRPWVTLKDINTYLESGSDNNGYEGLFEGEVAPVFPHDLPNLWDSNGGFDMIKATPYGNSITTDFAIAALDGENLGADKITDFLAVSFSSTDYVGHKFGVNSKEIQDTYIRLDRDLARLFKALDKKVGKDNYTLFLTADHAAIHVPAYLKDHRVPAGYVKGEEQEIKFNEFLKYKYGTTDIVENSSNSQIFLDHDIVRNLDLKLGDVEEEIARELMTYENIDRVYTGQQMWENDYTQGIPYILQNGYNLKRSGDILIVLRPGVANYSVTGSTHGSPQVYDTHVPLLFYGRGIQKGSTTEHTEISDIAPTISALLGIAFPSGNIGVPITKVIE
ncbi:MAG: alkaline phosphatase [Maribacter sp.]|nr:MAG: alkaline phosphatase [Maribacter sp.]